MKISTAIAMPTLTASLLFAVLGAFVLPDLAQAAEAKPIYLRHSSGLCIVPEDGLGFGNNTALVFRPDIDGRCSGRDPHAFFEHLEHGQLRHMQSGKCVHPRGGSPQPGNNTPLVLHDGCEGRQLVFTVLGNGAVQHYTSEKCVHPRGGRVSDSARLVLHNGCGDLSKVKLTFAPVAKAHIPGKRPPFVLRHPVSKTCLVPKDGNGQRNNVALVFRPDRHGRCADKDPHAWFQHLPSGSLRHVKSGKCVHPKGGHENAGNNTPLVLHDGCNERRLRFSHFQNGAVRHISGKCVHVAGGGVVFDGAHAVLHNGCNEAKGSAKFVFAKPTPAAKHDDSVFLLLDHSAKLCFAPANIIGFHNNMAVQLHADCSDYWPLKFFEHLPSGSLRHWASGQCIHPHGGSSRPGNNTKLVLHAGCNEARLAFTMLANGALRHDASGKCIHPRGGRAAERTGIVLHKGCDLGNKTTFIRKRVAPSMIPPRKRPSFVIRHIASDMCLVPKDGKGRRNNTILVFRPNRDGLCSGKDPHALFQHLLSGSIRHVKSGMCIHPRGLIQDRIHGGRWSDDERFNNVPLVLHDGCNEEDLRLFIQHQTRALKLVYIAGNVCVHPRGGKASDGGHAVFHKGCGPADGEKLKFAFDHK